MAATLSNDTRNLGMTISMLRRKLRVTARFFECIEIGTLYVFDDRNLKRFPIRGLKHQDWYLMMTGPLSRSPASFTGYDFEGISDARDRPHENRLKNSTLPDRSGQFVELVLNKDLPWVAWVGPQKFYRCPPDAAVVRGGDLIVNICSKQGSEATTKPRSLILGAKAFFRQLKLLIFSIKGVVGKRSDAPTALALNYFRCKFQICLAA